jgi:hypothetical protein
LYIHFLEAFRDLAQHPGMALTQTRRNQEVPMKPVLACIVALFALTPTVSPAAEFGQSGTVYVAASGPVLGIAPKVRVPIIQAHSRLVFLGCVYSYHECEHLGHSNGFYNHFTRHDHRTCHHGPSYACYGR